MKKEKQKEYLKRFIDWINWNYKNVSSKSLTPEIFFDRLIKEYKNYEDLRVICEGYIIFMNYIHYDSNRELFNSTVFQSVEKYDEIITSANSNIVDQLSTEASELDQALFNYIRKNKK